MPRLFRYAYDVAQLIVMSKKNSICPIVIINSVYRSHRIAYTITELA